jgi:sugar lactone lactonase YvrE
MKQLFRNLGLLLALAAFCWQALAHPGSGIVVDRKGRVYFTDTGQGIWKLDTAGKLVFFHKLAYHWMALDEQGHFARAASIPTGRRTADFQRITADGEKPALIISSDYPITNGRDGNLYYVPYNKEGTTMMLRQTPQGTTSVLATLPVDAEGKRVLWVNGIATGPDGAIYYTEDTAVRKISMHGEVSTVAGAIQVPGCAANPISSEPPPYLRDLAVDSRGTVYAAANGCRSVLKITPKGEVSVVLQAQSPWSPTGVTIHGGEVYVLEYDHTPVKGREWPPRVRKIARDGKVTTVVTVERKPQ